LCRQFDDRLVALLPHRGLADYRTISERISLDAVEAARWAHELADGSSELPPLVHFLRDAHGILMRELGACARAFRVEPVRVGGEGAHAFVGAPFESLHAEMLKLAERCPWPAPDVTRAELVSWAARFLVPYFRIHPFIDGNGRTARLVLEVAARRTRRMRFEWPQNARRRRS